MEKLNRENETEQCTIPSVSKAFICGVDYGDGNSQGAFTVFKNGKLHWDTTKAWKAKLYLMWCRIKGIKILKEAN